MFTYYDANGTLQVVTVANNSQRTVSVKKGTTVTLGVDGHERPWKLFVGPGDLRTITTARQKMIEFTMPNSDSSLDVRGQVDHEEITNLAGGLAGYTEDDFDVVVSLIDLSVYVADDIEPNGDYDLVYDDGSEYSHYQGGAGEMLWGHNAKEGTEAELISDIEDGDPFDQVWTVNGTQVSGRGKSLYFTLPDENCSFDITRSQQTGAVPVVINSITNLDGGMSSYTASDFHL